LNSRPGPAGRDPLFSIVTVVFNGARTLEATIESVSRQTFRDFEYIVLDGGSTDATVAILERRAPDIQYWKSEPDSGIYAAWNKALDVARGEWVAFLGADDVYYRDALAEYARAIRLAAVPGLQYVSSRVHLVKNGKPVRTVGSQWAWPAFSHHMTVAHVGSVHHRSLFKEYGRYDESYRISADYELLLRPRNRLRTAFLNRVTACMQLGGVSNANVQLALAEQERAKRTTGGRPAWRCRLERQTAYVRDRCRSLLWY
jgi:glycosyltransferase involved in cell wall biosynthesis